MTLDVVEGYDDLASDVATGRIDLAALSPMPYLKAKSNAPGLQLLATPVTHAGSSYEGLILARADSHVSSLADLRGKVFCYVTPNSTSGYLYPRALLRKAGLDPDSAFRATRFAGDHLAALRALYDGACDGAAVFAGILYEADRHGMSPQSFVTLASSPRIPYDAYVAAPELPHALVARIRKALLALHVGTPLARRVFTADNPIQGFAAVSDSDYDSAREVERYLDAGTKSGTPVAGSGP